MAQNREAKRKLLLDFDDTDVFVLLRFMVSVGDRARHGASQMIQLITGLKSGFHLSQGSETFAFTAMGTMQTLEIERGAWSTYMILDKLCWEMFPIPLCFEKTAM